MGPGPPLGLVPRVLKAMNITTALWVYSQLDVS